MEAKKSTQNQFDVSRHCEEGQSPDKAISKTLGDCHIGVNAAPRNDIAVLLVNFGGPDSKRAVKSFLYNLFSDPIVLNFPFASLYRKPFAWLISNLRYKASSKMYKKLNFISPLIPITYLQAKKLQQLLDKNNLPIDIFIGFRYCNPSIEDTLNFLKTKGYKKAVIFPLYPQYSYTTTGSVELIINKWLTNNSSSGEIKLFPIKNWNRDDDYITSFVNLIKKSLKHMDLRSTEIIFSAHSIPIINIENGDPYESHIKETASLIVQKLNWKKRWHIGYQSKLGPVKWLEPSCEKIIEQISQRNINANILVVPISFICEHVETVFEIGLLYKELAKKCGIKKFVRTPALNTDRYLIQALYNQVVYCLENNKTDIKDLLVAR